jgi:hypothetical protein
MTYSFWPWRFITLLVPDLFGNPATGDYWGYGNYWEDAIYIGLMPIVLAAGMIIGRGLISKKRNSKIIAEKSMVLFLFAVIVAGFIFALGKNTPIFPFLYNHIPTFDLFQAPTRFTIWVEISLALLAGLGINSLKPLKGKGVYWTRLAAAGCFAALISTIIAAYFLRNIETTFITSVASASIFGLGTSLLILFQPERTAQKDHHRWQLLVIGFISIDLILAGWGLNPAVDKNFYNNRIAQVDDSRIIMSASNEYWLKFDQLFKFDTFKQEIELNSIYEYRLPNSAMLNREYLVNNFDPIVPARYQAWMDKFNELEWIDQDKKVYHQALGLMTVGVISDPQNSLLFNVPLEMDQGGRLKYYQCVEYKLDENEILKQIMSEQIDTKNILLLNGVPENSSLKCAHYSKVEIDNIIEKPGSLSFTIKTGEAGWVYWSQTWFPGWKVKVDDNEWTPSLQANYLFQAVEVSKGDHKVEFAYRPLTFKIGAIISIFTIFLSIYLVLRESKRI